MSKGKGKEKKENHGSTLWGRTRRKIAHAMVEKVVSNLPGQETALNHFFAGVKEFVDAGVEYLKNKRKMQEDLQSSASRQEEIARKEAQYKELKTFLELTHNIIHKLPVSDAGKKKPSVLHKLKTKELTEGERQQRKTEQQQEKAKRKLIRKIPREYLYKRDICINGKTYKSKGANLRKWWVDNSFPVDEKGHPDMRWIQELTSFTIQDLNPLLISANLRAFNFSGMDLRHMQLFGADLAGANLAAADLSHTTINNADLREANLSATNISNTRMIHANLCEANLTNAILHIKTAELSENAEPIYHTPKGVKLREYLEEQQISINNAVFSEENKVDIQEGALEDDRDIQEFFLIGDKRPVKREPKVTFHVAPEEWTRAVTTEEAEAPPFIVTRMSLKDSVIMENFSEEEEDMEQGSSQTVMQGEVRSSFLSRVRIMENYAPPPSPSGRNREVQRER